MRIVRNTVDVVSILLVLGGAYWIHGGLAVMLVGMLGLLVVWRLDNR